MPLTKGQHEGLITLETHEKMQARRKGMAMAPARKDLNKDFPLRGFVTCGDCGSPLTAGWSTGKYRYYGYFLCQNKACGSYGKSIRKADIEDGFTAILRSLTPSQTLILVFEGMFHDAWTQRVAQAKQDKRTLEGEIIAADNQIEQSFIRHSPVGARCISLAAT